MTLHDELLAMLELDDLLDEWAIPNERTTPMRGAPIPPAEYDDENVLTDARLEEDGYATGLDVWEQVGKAYGNYVEVGVLANAQLWSLRQAIRAELLAELEHPDV